jgi:hypothetical protein
VFSWIDQLDFAGEILGDIGASLTIVPELLKPNAK